MDDSISALQNVGVVVHDMEGNIRPVARILDDLAKKWHDLSAEQQQFIGLQLAGRFQLSRFLVLMNNYQTAIEATNTAMNSAGSGYRENEEYLKSLEARLNRLSNAWTELAINAGDAFLTDGIIAYSEGLASLTKNSTGLISSIGFLPSVIGLASIAMATFNARMRDATYTQAQASASATGLAGAYGRLASSVTLAGAATRTLATILRAMPQMLVFMTAAWGIEKLVSTIVKAKEEARELEKRNKELTDSWIEQRDQIEELLPRFRELTEIKNSSVGLNIEQEQEYLDVQNKLAEIIPSLISDLDKKGNAHLLTGDALEREVELLKERERIERERRIENSTSNFENTINQINELNEQILSKEEYIKDMEDFNRFVEETGKQVATNSAEQFRLVREEIIGLRETINKETSNLSLNFSNDINDRLWMENIRLSREATDSVIEYANTLDLSEMSVSDYNKTIHELIGAFVLMNKSTDTQPLKDYSEQTGIAYQALLKLRESFQNVADSATKTYPVFDVNGEYLGEISGLADEAAKNFTDLEVVTNELTGEIESFTGSLISNANATNELAEKYNNAISSIESLNSILNELNEGQGLSAKTISTLMDEYDDLLPYLHDEIALREKIKEKIIEEQNQAKESIYEKTKDSTVFYQNLLKQHSDYLQELTGFRQEDLENFKSLAALKEVVETNLIKNLAGQWAKFYKIQKDQVMITNEEIFKDLPFSVQVDIQRTRNQLQSELDGIVNQFQDLALGDVSLSSSIDKSKSSKGKDSPANMDVIDSLIRQIRLESDLLAKERELINTRIQIADKNKDYNTQLEQTSLLLEKEEVRIQSLMNANRRFHEEANRIRAATKFDTSSWFDHDIEKSVEYVNQFNKSSKAQQEEMEKVFAQLQKLKRAYGENSSEVDSLKLSIDNLRDSLQEIRFNQIMSEVEGYKDSITLLDLELSILNERNKQLNEGINDLFNAYSDGNANIQQWVSSLENSKNIILQKIEATKRHIQYLESAKNSTDISRESQEKLNIEYLNAKLALEQYNNALIDNEKLKKQFLDKLFQEVKQLYIDGYNKQLKIVLDAIDREMKALEKSHKKKMEQLDDELKMIEEIIQARIKLIEEEDSEDQFNKRLQKAYKERSEILNKISILSLDNSYEAEAERSRLAEELGAKEEEIEEILNSRTKELRKNTLNELLSNYKEEVDKKKDTEQKKYELEKERLDRVRDETNRHYENLINDERRWIQLREDIMNQHFDNIKNDLAEMVTSISDEMSLLGESITANFIDKLNEVISLMSQLNSMEFSPTFSGGGFGGGGGSGGGSSGGGGSIGGGGGSDRYVNNPLYYNKSNSAITHIRNKDGELIYVRPDVIPTTDEERAVLEAQIERAKKHDGGIVGQDSHQPNKITDLAKNKITELADKVSNLIERTKKHDGGIVGQDSHQPNKITELANEMFNLKPNEQIIKALKGELFIPEHNLTRNFIPNLKNLVSSFQPIIPLTSTGGVNIGDLHFDFNGFSGSRQDARDIVNSVKNVVFEVINNGIRKRGYKN